MDHLTPFESAIFSMKIKNSILLMIAAFAFIFPYFAMSYWKSGIPTVILIWTFKKIFPENFKKTLGLEVKFEEIIKTTLLVLLVVLITEGMIRIILQDSLIERNFGPIISTWPLQPLFQAGNEEMIFRAAAFYFLIGKLKSNLSINFLIATTFVVIHFVFFWVNQNVFLSLTTMLSLFLATLAMNNFFLRFRNIAYTLAIHAGWNYQKFGASYTHLATHHVFNDGEKFNLIEGSNPVLLTAFLLFLGSLFLTKIPQKQV